MENETNQELELDTIETEVEVDEQPDDQPDYKVLYEEARRERNKYKNKLLGMNKSEKPKSDITNNPTDDNWKQRMELKVDGYDDDAINFILKNGGKKALENPYVVSAIDSIKTKKAAEAATLGEQGQKSGIEKRFTPQEFAKLSSDEQLKVLSGL